MGLTKTRNEDSKNKDCDLFIKFLHGCLLIRHHMALGLNWYQCSDIDDLH